jgi:hypothetical protein
LSSGSKTWRTTAASVLNCERFGSMLSGSPCKALIVISWAPAGAWVGCAVGFMPAPTPAVALAGGMVGFGVAAGG